MESLSITNRITSIDAFDQCVRNKEPILLSNHCFDIMKNSPREIVMALATKIGNLENKGWLYITKYCETGHAIILLPPIENKNGNENKISIKVSSWNQKKTTLSLEI